MEHGLENVALFDINPSHAEAEINKLRADFPKSKVLARKVDVTDAKDVEVGVASAVEEFGAIHILCCFAGVVGCTHAIDMSVEEWRRVVDINATGSFLCAKAAAK